MYFTIIINKFVNCNLQHKSSRLLSKSEIVEVVNFIKKILK